MATTKLTMMFQLQTQLNSKAIGGRVAGWSESWYYPGEVSQAIAAAVGTRGLCQLRANMLPRTGAIVAQRYQVVDSVPPGPSTTRYVNFPGGSFETDIPNVAILVNVPGQGVRNVKKLILRGIPDQFMIDGEYTPDSVFEPITFKFFAALAAWRFRGQDFNAAQKAINFISSTGDVNMVDNVTFTNGQKVTISGNSDPLTGRKIKTSTWTVLNPSGKVFTARGWKQANSTDGGQARLVSPAFFQPVITDIEVERATVRKVGRPFDLYRGRRRPA